MIACWLVLSGCTTDYAVGTVTDGAHDGSQQRDGPAADAHGNPGTGNGVLLVDGTISASEHENNASQAADFEVELTVGVSRGGTPVENAKVRIESAGGTVDLAHEGSGLYRAHQEGYHRRYALQVLADADSVTGVEAEGPAIHTILAPANGQRLSAGQALEVRWTVPSPASETTLETRDYGPLVIPDSGSYQVPGSAFVSAGGEEDDRVRVRRSEHQPIAGGAVGSRLTIRLRNQVEFKIVSN